MSAAEPGQVVIGAATREHLPPDAALDLVPLGPIRLKGKREPVEAWALQPPERPLDRGRLEQEGGQRQIATSTGSRPGATGMRTWLEAVSGRRPATWSATLTSRRSGSRTHFRVTWRSSARTSGTPAASAANRTRTAREEPLDRVRDRAVAIAKVRAQCLGIGLGPDAGEAPIGLELAARVADVVVGQVGRAGQVQPHRRRLRGRRDGRAACRPPQPAAACTSRSRRRP